MIKTREANDRVIRNEAGRLGNLETMSLRGSFLLLTLAIIAFLVTGCGMFNLGKWKGIEKTSADEKYYLVKDAFLSAGSSFNRRNSFDHNMNDSVNLYFIPKMETNTYVAESIWYDPNGDEFETIRKTYDLQAESKKGESREKTGTTRVHTIPTKKLFDHKPGLWTVVLYIEKDLARRLTFSVR